MNDNIYATDAALTGGKGSSLAILNSITGIEVPAFFCVTTDAFREHFKGKTSSDLLNEL